MRPSRRFLKTLAMVQLVLLLMLGATRCGDDGRSFRPGIDNLSCPAGDVALGTAAIFEWSASDPDGQVVGYYYGLDDDPFKNWTTAAACTLSNISVGTHVFFVVAVDNNDKRSPPVSCSFSVRELSHDCSVSPTSLDFGTVGIDSTADLSFTITNNGSTTFSGTAGESCDNYSIVSGGGLYILGGGQSHTVTVRFEPTSCGSHACTVDTGVGACSNVGCTGQGGAADCMLSATSLDFGTVDLGSSEDLTFTLTNTGCIPLAGTISESCDDYSIVSGGGSYSLEASEVLTVTVRYSPGSVGTHTCAIETGLTGTPCSAVQCTGQGAELTTVCVVSPTTLEFGVVEVGSGADLSFTITNSGTATLSGDLTESTAGDCGDFAIISGGGPYSLGAGESLTASVRFNPSSCGIKSCTIETGVEACSDVTCTGEGGISGCDISPESLDFGKVNVGASTSRAFIITNTGCVTLTGKISESCGDYSIISGGGSYSIEAGQSKAVTVRFEPSSCGTRTCKIETGSGVCPDLLCTGEGSDASCTVSPADLDFGGVEVGSTKDVSFLVRNTGCTILTGAISESCDDYSIVSGGGDFTLIQGQSRTVTVRFTPAACGTSTCAIGTGLQGCAVVRCAGVGERFDCNVNPTNFGFGTLEVGSYADATFTISNNGCKTISGTVTESCLDFSIISGGSYSIDPGESHVVTVRFSPSSAGARTCTIDTGDGSCPHFVCSGTGQVTDCIVSPASLDFGSVALGSSRDTTFTIMNNGSSTLSGEISETCADYEIISGGGAYSLSPGGSRVVTLRFSPTACGTRVCTIETGDGACSDVSCTGVSDLAACDVSPASFDFGAVALGSSVDTTFTITNNGCSLLSGTISGTCTEYEIISGGGAYSLSPGGSRVVTLRFSPTGCGTRVCTIETGDGACSDVSCTGVGDLVACDVSPASFDFGTVALGSSVDTTFTITNNGCGLLSGTISETCTEYEIISGGGAYSLSPGGSRVVTLRFSPTGCGTRVCTIETGDGACSDVSCTGVGDLSACDVSPASFDFGTVALGSSVDTTFTITNNGCDLLSGTISETCTEYEIISGGGAYSLSPGGSRVVTLRFGPTVCGTTICTIETGDGTCSDVSCTGVGDLSACDVSPASFDFGTVALGSSVDTTFTITNNGCGLLSGTISETCTEYEIISGGGAYSLSPGGSRVVTLRFGPTVCGTSICTIETGDGTCSDVSCTGVGDLLACDVSPASFDFGTVALGSSVDTTFTITNNGCSLLSGTISETCADYEIISGGGAYSLSPGGSRVVTLRFSPTGCGTRSCTIEMGNGACSDVSCTGVGDLLACDVSPASFDFGTVALGSSVDTTFTITNNGCSLLSGTISETCADYEIISGGGAYSLSAGGSRVVTLRFSPTGCGTSSCTIETGDGACSDVSCTGVGDLVSCDVSPASFDFGTVVLGSSVDTTFTITNNGCSLLSGTISETCTDYEIISGGGAYSLSPGGSRVVTLRFNPGVCGTRVCTIETGNDACSDVSCTGVSDLVACVVSPASFDFGTVILSSSVDTTFTITNLGCNPVSGTISETCADYEIISGGGAYSLSAGGSRVVTVRFSPTGCGTRVCTIETGDDACSDVSCTGVGEDYGCSVEPSSIDFGSVTVGVPADTTLTITNTGTCGTVTGTIAEACADFEILVGGGPFTLAPGEWTTVTLRFAPASAGAKSCTITLGSDHCSDVQCDGVGI